jgi:linoleoyl-CoA desaturase
MSRAASLRFPHSKQDFYITLTQRVNQYFKTNGISRNANTEMVLKTFFMYGLYFIPYGLIITGTVTNLWFLFGLCVMMGLGTAGIGLSIMHDANHGSYSKKKWVNDLLGYSLNLVGGHAFTWKVQHNVLHHTYTNIHDADEDISPRGVLRMAPESPWKPAHRFQHIYAWFLYGLLTMVWILAKDFMRMVKYSKDGHFKKQNTTEAKEWFFLLSTKAIYISYILVLPALLLPITWWQALIGFAVVHGIAGFILSIIFQPAHVIDGTEYPEPDESGMMENAWAIHQIRTTTNFANKSTFFSWYVGGLNFQIEHHLFPNVCHVHYRKISKIVKETTAEFGLPYKSAPTFLDAIIGHAKLLKQLGKPPLVVSR